MWGYIIVGLLAGISLKLAYEVASAPLRKRQPEPLPQAERFELTLSAIQIQVNTIACCVRELAGIHQQAMLVAANDRDRMTKTLEKIDENFIELGQLVVTHGEFNRLAATENGACAVGADSRLAAG